MNKPEGDWHKRTAWNRMLEHWLDNLHIATEEIMLLTTKPQEKVTSKELDNVRAYIQMTNDIIWWTSKIRAREEAEAKAKENVQCHIEPDVMET